MIKKRQAPELATGYILNDRSFYSVIKPMDGLNLVRNPEPKTLAGYSALNGVAGGATLSLVTGIAGARGTKTLQVSTLSQGAGVFYTLGFGVLANVPYTFSVDVLATGPLFMKFSSPIDPSIAITSTKHIDGYGKMRRYTMTAIFRTATDDCVLCVGSGASRAQIFWCGGWQLEQLPFETTYFSGAMTRAGSTPDYMWTGAPHNSFSRRFATAADGGQLIPLETLGLEISNESGLGEMPAVGDGADATTREITISGAIRADSAQGLIQKRSEIHSVLFGADSATSRTVYFAYQYREGDELLSARVIFGCKYSGGAVRNNAAMNGEDVAYTYKVVTPLHTDGLLVVALPVGRTSSPIGSTHIATNRPFASDTSLVDYELIDPPTMPMTSNLHYALNGALYVACTDALYRWDGTAWATIALGGAFPFNSIIESLESTPDGYLWIGFQTTTTQAAGVMFHSMINPGANAIFRLTASAPGRQAAVKTMKYVPEISSVLLGGTWTSMSPVVSVTFPLSTGTATSHNVNRYNISTAALATLGSGVGTSLATIPLPVVNAVEYDSRGLIWAGGKYSDGAVTSPAIGTTIAHLSYFDASGTWKHAGSPTLITTAAGALPPPFNSLTAEVMCLKFDLVTGNLYAGGVFNGYFRPGGTIPAHNGHNVLIVAPQSLTPSLTTGGLRVWTFVRPYPAGGGVMSTNFNGDSYVRCMGIDDKGVLHVGGDFNFFANSFVTSGLGTGTPINKLSVGDTAEWNGVAKTWEFSEFRTSGADLGVESIYVASTNNIQQYSFATPVATSDYRNNYHPNNPGTVTLRRGSSASMFQIERVFPFDIPLGIGGYCYLELAGNGFFYKIENVTTGDFVKTDLLNVPGASIARLNLDEDVKTDFFAGVARYGNSKFARNGSLRLKRGKNEIVLGYYGGSFQPVPTANIVCQPELSSVDEASGF